MGVKIQQETINGTTQKTCNHKGYPLHVIIIMTWYNIYWDVCIQDSIQINFSPRKNWQQGTYDYNCKLMNNSFPFHQWIENKRLGIT